MDAYIVGEDMRCSDEIKEEEVDQHTAPVLQPIDEENEEIEEIETLEIEMNEEMETVDRERDGTDRENDRRERKGSSTYDRGEQRRLALRTKSGTGSSTSQNIRETHG
eukprot:gnl/TRDRNA2_/TRDRNA2_149496_c3_seq1.p2 gnl/TRDRNA2_/TRDRNA2_149496_c3~~gnl/TRDRNA2_/TRDRNA2_149496_c3_seq1.p2  ORF type:complete len:108 (-),score=18.16 gnl/TRDRNA2_/TRDRNA2_149496_c3_seq1:454-777(-)